MATKAIYDKGFSVNSSVLLRSNFGVDGQESSPQSHTAAILDRYATIRKLKQGYGNYG